MNHNDVFIAQHLYLKGSHPDSHEFEAGESLEDFGVIKFYPVKTDDGLKLFVVFDVTRDIEENHMTLTSRAEESEFSINEYVLTKYHRYFPTMLNDLVAYKHAAEEEGLSFQETIYVGGGVGGCIASLISTKSTPHKVITFGMPNFCSEKIYELMLANATGRNERLAAQGSLAGRDFEFYNFQSVFGYNTRFRSGSPFASLGDVYWSDRNNRTHKNPSLVRRLFNEALAAPDNTHYLSKTYI